MSKIRPVRQRTDAPRQDEGPGTGAPLLAGAVLGLATDAVALAQPRQLSAHLAPAGGVYRGFAVADGRRSALLVQTGELLGFTALAALAVQRDSPGLLGAGWLAHTTWDALHHRGRGPTGYGPGTRRAASDTTWRSLRRCSPASSSSGASPASASPAGVQESAWPAGPGYLIRRWTTEPPISVPNGQLSSTGWPVNPPAARRLGRAHRR